MAKTPKKKTDKSEAAPRRRAQTEPTTADALPESTHSAQFYGDGETPRTLEPEPRAGRYPGGYGRSPDRIREDVKNRLTAHSILDASDIEVHVEGHEVVLQGRASDPGARTLAEDVAKGVAGVERVRNELAIAPSRGAA